MAAVAVAAVADSLSHTCVYVCGRLAELPSRPPLFGGLPSPTAWLLALFVWQRLHPLPPLTTPDFLFTIVAAEPIALKSPNMPH